MPPKGYIAPPPEFMGTAPEWLTYEALIKLGKKPGEDFTFQSSLLGGRIERGGLIVDFQFRDPPDLAINVQGTYWHYGLGPTILARDKVTRETIAGQGITLIMIDEDDLYRDAEYYVKEALNYRDHSRLARGD